MALEAAEVALEAAAEAEVEALLAWVVAVEAAPLDVGGIADRFAGLGFGSDQRAGDLNNNVVTKTQIKRLRMLSTR